MTTRSPSKTKLTPAPMPRWRVARTAWMMSIACWSLVCATGCGLLSRKVVVIPADKQVRYLKAGQTYTATNDTYLVPPARMQEILRALGTNTAQ